MTSTHARRSDSVYAPRTTAPFDARARVSHGPVPRAGWFVLMALALAVLVLDRAQSGLGLRVPDDAASLAAVAVTGCYAGGLAHRTGGRPFVAGVLGALLGAVAVVSDLDVLVSGVALATTVLSGLFAVLVTRPAVGVLATGREIAIAIGTAAVGALAASAYQPGVDASRFRWVALVAALGAVLVLVDGLGAGLHGLGRRGLLLMVGGAVFLLAAVAYGEALTRWGNPGIVALVADTRTMLVSRVGAVPHPVPALLGIPALAWGVFMRARRRQGWWACAFGVAATTSTAAALVDPNVTLTRAALGEALSLAVGLLIGYVVIRLDLYFTGPRGRRARADEEAHALRPEPGRTRALR